MARGFAKCFIFAVFSVQALFADLVYVADSGNATVYQINSATNMVIAVATPLMGQPFVTPFAPTVSPDAMLIYVTDRGAHGVFVIDPTPAATQFIPLPSMPMPLMGDPILTAFTPDQSTVLVTDITGHVFVIDVGTHSVTAEVSTIGFPGFTNPLGVAILDNSTGYVADQGSGLVYIIDIPGAAVTGTIGPFTQPTDIRISADGSFAYLTDYTGADVFKINLGTNMFSAVMNNTSTPFAITNAAAITPTSSFAYVTDFSANAVYPIETMSNSTLPDVVDINGFTPFAGMAGIAVIPDGSLAYAAGLLSQTVYTIDVLMNKVIAEVDVNGHIAFSAPTGVATTPFASPAPVVPDSPENLRGHQRFNDFGLEYSYSNLLFWNASPSGNVAGYTVYRNGVKIASLGSSTLQYTDRTVSKNTLFQYAVTAFDAMGLESAPIAIEIR